MVSYCCRKLFGTTNAGGASMALFARRTILAPAAPPPRIWGMHYLVQPDEYGNFTPDTLVARVQEAAANAEDGTAGKPAAAASVEKKNSSSPEPWATVVAATVFGVSALVAAWLLFG